MPAFALPALHSDCEATVFSLWPAAFRALSLLHPRNIVGPTIIQSAGQRLERAATAQAKRLYYHGRSDPSVGKTDQLRNKVFLGGSQLFQLLLYRESDRYEWTDEASTLDGLSERVLLARFVKQLVQLTLPRNAFHVALAMGRFLFDYSGSETLRLYDSLFGDFRRFGDESYIRARKALLLNELQQRFGNRLILVQGRHRESRFLELPESAQFRGLVRQCLNVFAPWGTPCLGSQSSAVLGLPLTRSPGNDHQSELRRMHVLLHPPCLELHCWRLGLPSPFERLRLPHFCARVDPKQQMWIEGSNSQTERRPIEEHPR